MEILKYFTSITIISGVVAYLARSIINVFINRDIERFKFELQKATLEHQIVFTKLHEDRGTVIKNIYQLLVKMQRRMLDLVGYTSTEYANEAIKGIIDLKNYFEENKIFLSQQTAATLEEIIDKTHNAYFEASWNHEYHNVAEIKQEKIKEKTLQKRLEGWDKVKSDVPPLLVRLEEEFRSILGVN